VKARETELKMTSDPQRQAQLTEDITAMRATINERRDQIQDAVTGTGGGTRAVGGKGGFELDNMLDDMAKELKADFAKFKTLVNERDAARARLKPLKDRLDRCTGILEQAKSGQ
jgi:hypothetical protein